MVLGRLFARRQQEGNISGDQFHATGIRQAREAAALANPAARLNDDWGSALRRVLVPIPPDIADRLRHEQASDLASVVHANTVVGIGAVGLLAADFARSGGGAMQTGISGALIMTYLLTFWRARAWRGANNAHGAPTKFIDDTRGLSLILGALWAILLIVATRHANNEQLNLLIAAVVGCLVAPVLTPEISCGFAFWLPLAIGSLTAALGWKTIDPFAITGLLGLIAVTGFSMVHLNNRLTERAITGIRQEIDGNVISLLLRDFEETTSDWLWETNAALELINVSDRFAMVAGRPPHLIAGTFPAALFGGAAGVEAAAATQVNLLNRLIEQRVSFREVVVPVTVHGDQRSWSLAGKPTFDRTGQFAGYHGVGSDVTAQLRSQQQIAFLARHDSLTKLPNRVQLGEALHQACARSDASGIALICLDLDDFKLVNDKYGHATGDGVLVAVAERLRGCLRDGDMAGRLGGDEFAIILMTADIEHVGAVARRIIERIGKPYQFDGQMVQLGISVGVALAPDDGQTPSGLMKNADLALYRAKADGKGVWRLYDAAMDERLQDRRSLLSDLRQALGNEEFCLEFQPIVDLKAQRIVGAEALLRWRHPKRGMLPPAQFIQLAEEAGLIGPIGNWVLRKACQSAAAWPDHVCVAVNMSPLQFRDPDLVDVIDGALTGSGLTPARLELEITETTMLETSAQTVDTLWQLHGRGIRIALDDFGTGYSSLSYLRRFPFDKIKIDRCFIRDLGFEKDDSSIILAIIGLAESMNMIVTAEGVETSEQAALLASYGCAQGQGFLFYRPVSAEKIAGVIAADDQNFDWTTASRSDEPKQSAGEL